jgi:hypothetical protein
MTDTVPDRAGPTQVHGGWAGLGMTGPIRSLAPTAVRRSMPDAPNLVAQKPVAMAGKAHTGGNEACPRRDPALPARKSLQHLACGSAD